MARGAPAIWLPALAPALSIALARITAAMMVFSNQIPMFLHFHFSRRQNSGPPLLLCGRSIR